MRALRPGILRLAITACLSLGLVLPAAAVADGPPYSDGSIPDGVASCFGGPYDIVERDGDLYVRCWGGVPGGNWAVFTTGTSLSGTSATVTVSRAHAGGRALIGYETRSGTATAGVDFTTTAGRLYFAEGQTVGTLTVPLAAFPPPPGTPARQFTVEFSDPVDLGLSVPTATVELPAVAASPDPGYPNGPPYAPGVRLDGDYACDGGFYSLVTHNRDRFVRCLGAVGHYDWQRFSGETTVGPSSATVTIRRIDGIAAPALVGFATEPGTATAGRDFVAASGELYFAQGVTSRTLTIPIVRDPSASADRRFAVRLSQPVNLGLTLPEVTVTIPGNPPTQMAPPTISGRARVGETLAAADGEWTHEPTGYARSWERCDAAGDACVAIDGAEGATYEPVVDDVGARLRVAVTATNGSGSDVARSASSAVVRSALVAPEITSGPSGSQILHRATFGFDGEDGATFECRLGDGAFAACTSPRTLTELPAGAHRFEVRQRATDGVVSDRQVREWTVQSSPDPEYPLAPPYGFVIDAFSSCEGGEFSLATHHGDRYARCGDTPGSLAWQRFSASADVDGNVATVTLTRDGGGGGPAVIGFATSDDTAVAGDDYTAAEGELFFAQGVTSRALEIPVVRDPGAASDRSFTVMLRDVVNLHLRVEDATVTIPGNPPGPGPGDPPPGDDGPPLGPPTGVPAPPPVGVVPLPPVSRGPVRMTTVRMQLGFCRGCTTLTAKDRKRVLRLRGRVDGSRLLAIDGYGDRGRSRAANRKLARARARAVERLLLSGVKRRPARRTVVGHARATAPATSQAGKRSAARDGVVTVRVVNRR